MKNNIKYLNLLILCLFVGQLALAQEKKEITLEAIWAKGQYFGEHFESLRFMNDDRFYTVLEPDETGEKVQLVRYSITQQTKTVLVSASNLTYQGQAIIPEEYTFSDNEQRILFATEVEPIYRRSSTALYYVYDIPTKSLSPLSLNGKQSNPAFSPDGNSAAFTRNNNLVLVNLLTQKETPITSDGVYNKIINGSTDWVYEEEFEFTQAYTWSPDSKRIVFYKFDETEVPEYSMQVWGGLYPQSHSYKYPKAGDNNAVVSIHCYDIANAQITAINTGVNKDCYVPRIKWTKDAQVVSILKLNRLQNHLEIVHANVVANTVTKVYEEKNQSYIEINDHLTYLDNAKGFILSSEQDGFRHLYWYDLQGKLIKQITKGNWEVDAFLGVDEKKEIVYYTSTEVSPMERHFYSTSLQSGVKKRLTTSRGVHAIEVSSALHYFIDQHSTIEQPTQVAVYNSDGVWVKTLSTNEVLNKELEQTKISKPTFFQFKNSTNELLNGFLIQPYSVDATKKYPVLLFVYGGPGSQEVKDEWMGPNYAWFQMLAQQGYAVVCIDGRGTGGRGSVFKKSTQFQLGKLETEDVISAAKYLATLSFIDKDRIGIFGWSFGGYMASLAMTVGGDYFKTGIAVAPVISWRFYDTIYTERFLGLPKDNATGYDLNSPLSHADKLKGNFLLIHGTADDNVHVQNSIEMERALIKANKQFTSFHYPDKNHGIYGGNTRLHLYQMMTDFLRKNL